MKFPQRLNQLNSAGIQVRLQKPEWLTDFMVERYGPKRLIAQFDDGLREFAYEAGIVREGTQRFDWFHNILHQEGANVDELIETGPAKELRNAGDGIGDTIYGWQVEEGTRFLRFDQHYVVSEASDEVFSFALPSTKYFIKLPKNP